MKAADLSDMCSSRPKPCCKEHFPTCFACGDPTQKLRREGRQPGAFCNECDAEIQHGRVRPSMPAKTNRMSPRARLRALQDGAR